MDSFALITYQIWSEQQLWCPEPGWANLWNYTTAVHVRCHLYHKTVFPNLTVQAAWYKLWKHDDVRLQGGKWHHCHDVTHDIKGCHRLKKHDVRKWCDVRWSLDYSPPEYCHQVMCMSPCQSPQPHLSEGWWSGSMLSAKWHIERNPQGALNAWWNMRLGYCLLNQETLDCFVRAHSAFKKTACHKESLSDSVKDC